MIHLHWAAYRQASKKLSGTWLPPALASEKIAQENLPSIDPGGFRYFVAFDRLGRSYLSILAIATKHTPPTSLHLRKWNPRITLQTHFSLWKPCYYATMTKKRAFHMVNLHTFHGSNFFYHESTMNYYDPARFVRFHGSHGRFIVATFSTMNLLR